MSKYEDLQRIYDKIEKNGWCGIDMSWYISLFEYGLLWIYRPKLHDFLCIFGTHFDDELQEFDEFATEWFDKSAYNDFENLINNADFKSCMDVGDDEWNGHDFDDIPYMIYEIISYYGWQEVVSSGGLEYNVDEILAYISQPKWGK